MHIYSGITQGHLKEIVMSNESILNALIELDEIQDKTAIGIAQLAIDQGYENLSPKQKFVLEKYLSSPCQGDKIDNICGITLTGEALEDALNEFPMYEKISCFNCRNNMDHQSNAWNKIQSE